uniref:NADH dehydrogenase subunit 6 n=1 Tax=Baicaloclepsis echinulata TaxID=2995197 RepID=A0A9E8G7R2_9ANNE|nr:NADH dehydrogenase subunit 6 [Baicaloclepsis echinulata]UZT67828.1 NADH dehydrogenase subunit 6 [Baicaloclepsis echinulata]
MSLTIMINMLMSSFLTMMILNNPLTMILNILLMALLTSWIYGFILSSWYSFLIFLIYVGGMLVMFAYFVALTPNQMLKIKLYFLTFNMTFFLLMMPFILGGKTLVVKNFHYFDSMELYSSLNLLLVFMIILLLLTIMLLVVKMINTSKGPLRPYLYV